MRFVRRIRVRSFSLCPIGGRFSLKRVSGQTGVEFSGDIATNERVLYIKELKKLFFKGGKMSLNIKNPETEELAHILARETGETVTRAVTVALRERYDRLRKVKKGRASAEELLDIGKRCATTLKHPPIDHDRLLYDERGLPK